MVERAMIQKFSENVQDHMIHYLSRFAEMVDASAYVAEQAGVTKPSGWVIRDVEVFAAGDWNGITFTDDDLDHMVGYFHQLKDAGTLEPPFKVNHSEDVRDQAGWILDVRRQDSVLLADIQVTEWEAYDKIQSGTWKNVSAEIYMPEMAQQEFGINDYVLRAVAVVSIPKVKNIKGIVLNSESWDVPEGGETVNKLLQLMSELGIQDLSKMTDEQKTQLNDKLKENGVELFAEFAPKNPPATQTPPAAAAEPEGQHLEISADQIVALSERLTTLDKTNKNLTSQVATLMKGSKKAVLDKWFTSLAEQGKVLPAEKEEVMAFAETLEGDALEAYKKTFEKRPKLVTLGETGAHQSQEEDDETEKAFTAYSENFGQKLYK